MFERFFVGRIRLFDRRAACVLAEYAAVRRSIGRPLSFADGQIVAIARSCDMIVAMHNVKDFAGFQMQIVNPWETVERLSVTDLPNIGDSLRRTSS